MSIVEGLLESKPMNEKNTGRKRRIFWLGAHKILIKTELKLLRDLGYEVFVPSYLSNVDDQSAVTQLQSADASTLPKDIILKLSEYNFFYNSVDQEIAEILNTYFDGAIVTIVGRWCAEFLRAFEGPVLFRAYGQTSLLSEDFERLGMRGLLEDRHNVHFLPHAEETGEFEGEWLKRKMRVVPYSIAPDIFDREGSWRGSTGNDGYILISAPNIANIFHRFHYRFLKKHFYQSHYRYVGVQTKPIDDPQVLGTLSLDEVKEQFTRASGYLYTYSDPRVCYLPPIEMMAYGGPVIYLKGSLLARYFNNCGPGECQTIEDAYDKSQLLLRNDTAFVSELQSAQASVVERYRPSQVAPRVEAAVRDLIGPPMATAEPLRAPHALAVTRSAMTHSIGRSIIEALLQNEDPERALAIDNLIDQVSTEYCDQSGTSANKHALSAWWREAPPAELDVQWGAVDVLNHPQASGLIGRWVIDPGTEEYAREASAGEAGYLTFGPYLSVQSGRYAARFALEIEAFDTPVTVTVDVADAGIQHASRTITVGEGCVSSVESLDWLVATGMNSVEFRVLTNGTGRVRLTSLTYDRKPD
ncbi:glycosyltransferase [Rhizobium sp. FY34]|uniref:glycosyltransferase n=1 Tax=Rhizobium sp. FY34 TaxID=2562309 RepID=UPI0010BFE215|nr:glycosyltransferase [Rhizobium sp. FY34]